MPISTESQSERKTNRSPASDDPKRSKDGITLATKKAVDEAIASIGSRPQDNRSKMALRKLQDARSCVDAFFQAEAQHQADLEEKARVRGGKG